MKEKMGEHERPKGTFLGVRRWGFDGVLWVLIIECDDFSDVRDLVGVWNALTLRKLELTLSDSPNRHMLGSRERDTT